MSLSALHKLGLSPGEITVYEALLRLGKAPMNTLHEKVGIERRNIYDILNKLIERGLVTYISENRKRYFRVTHPNKIISYIEEKAADLEQTKEEIREQIPTITKIFESHTEQVNAEIFRGAEGVKAVWDDMLTVKETFWIGSGNYVPDKYPKYYAHWDRQRIKAKNKRYNIFRAELRGKAIPSPLHYIKYLPPEFSGSPFAICVYGNKVANMFLGNEYFAVVIESEEAADSFRRYHKFLWEKVCTT